MISMKRSRKQSDEISLRRGRVPTVGRAPLCPEVEERGVLDRLEKRFHSDGSLSHRTEEDVNSARGRGPVRLSGDAGVGPEDHAGSPARQTVLSSR